MGVPNAAAEGDIATERPLAEGVAQLGIGAEAELVTRRRKRNNGLPLVRQDPLEEGSSMVIDNG
jgi:hypothetical protein